MGLTSICRARVHVIWNYRNGQLTRARRRGEPSEQMTCRCSELPVACKISAVPKLGGEASREPSRMDSAAQMNRKAFYFRASRDPARRRYFKRELVATSPARISSLSPTEEPTSLRAHVVSLVAPRT